uniref:Uncharacterized protein n=1 Tax=Buteo japonicus TaxID=224669 RepID=A0A8C0BVA3_9AVES
RGSGGGPAGPAPGRAVPSPASPQPGSSPVFPAAFKPVDLGDLKRRNTQDAKKS